MSVAIIRINPPIPLNTPKGSAYAHFLIDNGIEDNLHWVCFQDDTGECWTWDNSKIRATKNVTINRTAVSPIAGVAVSDEEEPSTQKIKKSESERDKNDYEIKDL